MSRWNGSTTIPTDDYGAALQRMRAGELDLEVRLPVQEIDWINANIPQTRHPVPLLGLEYLEVNHSRKPFDDIRVREAINLALNREAIAQRIRRIGDIPAYCVVPPGTANFPGGNSFAFHALPYGQRIERARSLMRDAGYSDTQAADHDLHDPQHRAGKPARRRGGHPADAGAGLYQCRHPAHRLPGFPGGRPCP